MSKKESNGLSNLSGKGNWYQQDKEIQTMEPSREDPVIIEEKQYPLPNIQRLEKFIKETDLFYLENYDKNIYDCLSTLKSAKKSLEKFLIEKDIKSN